MVFRKPTMCVAEKAPVLNAAGKAPSKKTLPKREDYYKEFNKQKQYYTHVRVSRN